MYRYLLTSIFRMQAGFCYNMSKMILRALSTSSKLLRLYYIPTVSPYLTPARNYSPYSRASVFGHRSYATNSTTDEKIRDIQEL